MPQSLYIKCLRNQDKCLKNQNNALYQITARGNSSKSISRESEGIRTLGKSGQNKDIIDKDTPAKGLVDKNKLASIFNTITIRVGIAGEPGIGSADSFKNYTPLSNGQNDNY